MTAFVDDGLTASQLRELLTYDPDTGEFRWRNPGPRKKKPGVAGGVDKDGYWRIFVLGRYRFAHRLAWLYVHGRWPDPEVDHRNGTKADNRIVNLREVTRRINQQNRRRANCTSRSGLLGAHYVSKTGMYRAQLRKDGVKYDLGGFDTALAAHNAYVTAKRRMHEGCTL